MIGMSRVRQISTEKANRAYTILVLTVGARDDPEARETFVSGVTKASAMEFRFGGHLGFGGKFRNNGNRDGIPYVDCYPEDVNPARNEMIRQANLDLAALFRGA